MAAAQAGTCDKSLRTFVHETMFEYVPTEIIPGWLCFVNLKPYDGSYMLDAAGISFHKQINQLYDQQSKAEDLQFSPQDK